MTTVYKDKQGNVIRTDKGTLPRGAKPKPAPKPSAEPVSTTKGASKRAGKE